MTVNNDTPRRQAGTTIGWRSLAARQRAPLSRRKRWLLVFMAVAIVLLSVFAGVRAAAIASPTNDQLTVRIGNQQTITVDLRQRLPISPDLFGVNVGTQSGTTSQDNATGTMSYSPTLVSGLRDANIGLLRFPGGNWGEQHYLSLDQLQMFAALLNEVNADGMMQARLSGPIGNTFPALTDVIQRAEVAGGWVDFMNNQHSYLRTGTFVHAPYHPVKYWTVGDAPDTLNNPATGKPYTVAQYVQDFIQFSLIMHQHDPTIQVFGPDISQFNGPGNGPTDSTGQLWMEDFLKGVGAYEQSHPALTFHLLDGVSFHQFQPASVSSNPPLLLSSTNQWNYLLPQLHQLITQYLKRDAPIAITALNTNLPGQSAPPAGIAALWWADTLGTLMNQQVAYVAFSSATGQNAPFPLFTAQNVQPTPMYRVMQLFTHLQRNLIPIQAQHDPISLYATQDDTHSTISLLFVNKAGTAQLAQIGPISQFLSVSPWQSLNVTLPSDSIVVITLHRGGTAEAYSYNAPDTGNSNTAPIIHIPCGNNAATLSNNNVC